MSGIQVEKIYKRKQSGDIRGPSGSVYKCVAGIVEVSQADAMLMRECGWGNPPGKATPVRRTLVTPKEAPITKDQIEREFAGLLQAGTTSLLSMLPEGRQEAAVEAGATDWDLARSILGKKYGPRIEEIIPEYPEGQEPEPVVPDVPTPVEAKETAQEGAPATNGEAEGNGEASSEEFTRDDLEKLSIPQLLEGFVAEAELTVMKKLKKADLVNAILGEGE